jgi:hypothetical protein
MEAVEFWVFLVATRWFGPYTVYLVAETICAKCIIAQRRERNDGCFTKTPRLRKGNYTQE